MKYKIVLILIFIGMKTFAQQQLSIGDNSPKIYITDYVHNEPIDKNLEKKFIVLDFWATWCAPCLAVVPHINELQQKFKDRKDVVFFSMTDENPARIQRTLAKIPFTTSVVCDQSKTTKENFGIQQIPQLMLIDNLGIVRWIGNSFEINELILENFLAGKTINFQNEASNPANNPELVAESEANFKKMYAVFDILKDENTKYIFDLTIAPKMNMKMAVQSLSEGKYVDFDNNLQTILSKINNKFESQIIIPKTLSGINYNLTYKNSDKKTAAEYAQDLKSKILSELKLTETIVLKKSEVYNLKVENPKKLDFSTNQDEINHSSVSDTHFVYGNISIDSFIKEIANYNKIIINNETDLSKTLEFTIRKGSLSELYQDLAEYGLSLEKTFKVVEFYKYN